MLVDVNVTEEHSHMFETALTALTLDFPMETAIVADTLADGTPVVIGCAVTGDDEYRPMLMLITPEVRHLFGDRLTPQADRQTV